MIFTLLYLFVCAASMKVWFGFGEFVTVAIIDIIYAMTFKLVREVKEEGTIGRIKKW